MNRTLLNRIFVCFLLITTSSFSGSILYSQQVSQYSLFLLNKYGHNPAYAGHDEFLTINGVYRDQWVGIPGSPNDQQLNAHMPLYYLQGGVGLLIENNTKGAERITSGYLSYNYNMPFGKKYLVSIGANIGVIQTSLDGSKLITPEGEYNGTVNHNESALPQSIVSVSNMSSDIGIYLKAPFFDFGFSVKNLLEPVAILEQGVFSTQKDYKRHFNIFASSDFNLGSVFAIEPGVMIKSDLIETQLDISLLLHYNDQFFVGCSFRGYSTNTYDGVVLMGGMKLSEKFSLAYAYDLTISPLNEVSNGSHEIMLIYRLNSPVGKGKLPKIINNPRFL